MDISRPIRTLLLPATNALLAMSIAVVVSFIAFFLAGADIGVVTTWMVALGLLAFGGTFTGSYIAQVVKKEPVSPPVS